MVVMEIEQSSFSPELVFFYHFSSALITVISELYTYLNTSCTFIYLCLDCAVVRICYNRFHLPSGLSYHLFWDIFSHFLE